MQTGQAVDLIRNALMASFWLSAPLLAIGFLVGILVSIFQVLTSLQDPAVGSLPRLAAYLFGFIVLLPWMVSQWTNYATALLSDLSRYAH